MEIPIKIPKLKKGFKKGSLVINPEVYWNAILFLILILIIFVFVFGFLLFRKVSQEPGFSSEESGSKALVQEEKLADILEHFEMRGRKSAEIIASPSPIIDPSL